MDKILDKKLRTDFDEIKEMSFNDTTGVKASNKGDDKYHQIYQLGSEVSSPDLPRGNGLRGKQMKLGTQKHGKKIGSFQVSGRERGLSKDESRQRERSTSPVKIIHGMQLLKADTNVRIEV
jgi:hypothetical protein